MFLFETICTTPYNYRTTSLPLYPSSDYFTLMATVNFLYRSTKPEANLNLRLLYRVSDESFKDGYNDIVLGAKTRLKVSKYYWSKQHTLKRVKDIEISNKQTEINQELNRIENHILTAFYEVDPKSINKSWLASLMESYYNPKQNGTTIPKDLIGYIDYYIEEREHEITPASITKFKVIKHKMERLQSERRHTIMIDEIGEDFKKEFVGYYQSENYSQNTMQRELGLIKTFCKHAKTKGLEIHPELLNLKLKKKPVKSIYLSFEELKQIEAATMEHDYQDNARDWLIISCYTGQRISDFMRFTSNMIREENGKKLLEFKQQKTNKLMTIPLHPKVLAILKKRNGEFPRAISDQRYNGYIKKVCELAKLKEKVEGKKQADIDPEGDESKIRAVSGTFEKWELVTSHIGRRSFATNFYGYNNIPTSYLIYVTGHSSEAMFLNYIGKSNKDLAIELTNYF